MQPTPHQIPRSPLDLRRELVAASRLIEGAHGIEDNGVIIGLHVASIPESMTYPEFVESVVKFAQIMDDANQVVPENDSSRRTEGLRALASAKAPTVANNDSSDFGGVFILPSDKINQIRPYSKVGCRSPLPTKPGFTDRLFKREWPAFLYAVADGNFAFANELLDRGDVAEEHVCQYGDNALIYAILSRNVKLVRKLLGHGWSTEIRRMSGETPLILAAGLGHLSTVELLIEHGADIEARDKRGDTALIASIPSLAFGESRNSQREQIAHLLLQNGADPDSQNHKGVSPLIRASIEDSKPFVYLLKDFGANVMIRDNQNRTAGDVARYGLKPSICWDVPRPRDNDEMELTEAITAAKEFQGEHDDILGDHDTVVTKCCLTCHHWNHQWIEPWELSDEEVSVTPHSAETGMSVKGRCRYANLEWGPRLPVTKEVRISEEIAGETCCHAWKDENLLKFLLLDYTHEAIGHKARHPELRTKPRSTEKLRAIMKGVDPSPMIRGGAIES